MSIMDQINQLVYVNEQLMSLGAWWHKVNLVTMSDHQIQVVISNTSSGYWGPNLPQIAKRSSLISDFHCISSLSTNMWTCWPCRHQSSGQKSGEENIYHNCVEVFTSLAMWLIAGTDRCLGGRALLILSRKEDTIIGPFLYYQSPGKQCIGNTSSGNKLLRQ